MELLLSKDNDTWAMHVGRYRIDSPPIPLVPASQPLFRLVTAIKNVYPDARIWLDPTSFENPFVVRRLHTYRRFNLALDLQEVAEVQYALDNPEIKDCSLCHGRAYYNTDVQVWVCSNCGAHESYIDKARFFKVRRRR